MSHAHYLVVGTSGSGKTSIARQLLQLTPRAVVVDPQGDYGADPGVETFPTFAAWSAAFLERHESDAWRLAYSPKVGPAADGGFRAVMALTYRARMMLRDRDGCEPAPVGVFLEEASIYSDANSAPAELDWLVRAGRKAGISTVNVVQADVDIAKTVRRNMTATIAFRSHRPGTELRRSFDPSELAGLDTLFGPGGPAVEGTHYLVDPPGVDPYQDWRAAVDP